MQYMIHLDFIFEWFEAFFSMPLTLPFIAGSAFCALELLEHKIMRG